MLKASKIKLISAGVFLSLIAFAPQSFADDVVKGSKVFRMCKACHSLDKDVNKVGPSLYNIVGKAVASEGGFSYSKAMIEFGADGKVWDEANLDAYLLSPRSVVPKTKMGFPGLRKEDDRENVIAYLKSLEAE